MSAQTKGSGEMTPVNRSELLEYAWQLRLAGMTVKDIAGKLAERFPGYGKTSTLAVQQLLKRRQKLAEYEQRLAALSRLDKASLESWAVEDLPIDLRARKTLRRGGFLTVGNLIQSSKEKLLKTKGVGCKSFNEVKDLLERLGVRLGSASCGREPRSLQAAKTVE